MLDRPGSKAWPTGGSAFLRTESHTARRVIRDGCERALGLSKENGISIGLARVERTSYDVRFEAGPGVEVQVVMRCRAGVMGATLTRCAHSANHGPAFIDAGAPPRIPG